MGPVQLFFFGLCFGAKKRFISKFVRKWPGAFEATDEHQPGNIINEGLIK